MCWLLGDGRLGKYTNIYRDCIILYRPRIFATKDVTMVSQLDISFPVAPQTPDTSLQQSVTIGGLTPLAVERPSSSWSWRGLVQPATAIAKAASPDRNARQKRGGGKSPLTTPAEKRQRQNSSTDSTLAQSAGSASASAGSATAEAASSIPTEEDRQRRIQNRVNGILAVRKSPEYLYLASL